MPSLHSVLSRLGLRPAGRSGSIEEYALPESAAEGLEASADTDLARMFYRHRGRVIHKWTHYLDVYERYFARYRGTPVHMLEIGVFQGGSLELWRNYLGEQATIFGIDINPACAGYVCPPNQVRIGSQADPDFLREVVAEMGSLDIVLDDGSHVATHQRESFRALFPLLNEGGLYVIEDLHTSYWPYFEGAYGRKGTAVEYVKQMIDDMHGWYHDEEARTAARGSTAAIHVYDSIVVIEKRKIDPPRHIKVGTPAPESAG